MAAPTEELNVNVPAEERENDLELQKEPPKIENIPQQETSSSSAPSGSGEIVKPSINHKVGTLSKLWGVSWDKKNKRWCSQLTIPGGKRMCKSFKKETDAALEYDRLVREHDLVNLPLNYPTEEEKAAGRGDTKKTSNYRGVHWHKSKKLWVSSIQVCGKKKCLGNFKTEEEAAKRYDADAMYFEDRQLNFPEDYPEHVYSKSVTTTRKSETQSAARLAAVELTQLQSQVTLLNQVPQSTQQNNDNDKSPPMVPINNTMVPMLSNVVNIPSVSGLVNDVTAFPHISQTNETTMEIPGSYNQLSSARLESLKINKRKRKVPEVEKAAESEDVPNEPVVVKI